MHFFHFYSCSIKTCFAYNFSWCIFKKLFQRIQNQREILRFLLYIFLLDYKKIVRGHISTF
jgi:hypothetical protein